MMLNRRHGETFGEARERRIAERAANAEVNAAKKAARLAAVMTCQCCNRKHLANNGKIAHHGFERPGSGWQTASCIGLECRYRVVHRKLNSEWGVQQHTVYGRDIIGGLS